MYIWNVFTSKYKNEDCKAILTREHIRSVYSTPETPTKEDEIKKEEIKNRLIDKGIWFYEDPAKKMWYDREKSEERILIIGKHDNKVHLLDEFSSLVKNMSEVKQIRIYVKLKDREKALKVVK